MEQTLAEYEAPCNIAVGAYVKEQGRLTAF